MRQAVKKQGKNVEAYQLGNGDPMETLLIEEGAITDRGDGTYELFSQEAVNGAGQIAKAGDYFKVDVKDEKHFPYPNEKAWFEEHHRPVSGNTWEQIPQPVEIYQLGDEMSPQIRKLVDSGALTINTADPEKTFSAHLWGTDLSLPKDGTVVIYGVNGDGSVDFNLIQAEEFERDYREEVPLSAGEYEAENIWGTDERSISLFDYLSDARGNSYIRAEYLLKNRIEVILGLTNCAKNAMARTERNIKLSDFEIRYQAFDRGMPYGSSFAVRLNDDPDIAYSIQDEESRKYLAPEGMNANGNESGLIYMIGAILFRSVVILDDAGNSEEYYQDRFYEKIDVMVKNSRLITSSSWNYDLEAVKMLADLLKKCLATLPENRYEDLRSLRDALVQLKAKADGLAERLQRGDPRIAMQKLLFDHPLYEAIPTDGNPDNGIPIRVLVVGSGAYGQTFIDLCLQAAQMNGHSLSLTALSDSAKEDLATYVRFRPDIGQFINLNGEMDEVDAARAYGSLDFVGIPKTSEERKKLFDKNKVEEGESFHYVFIALGNDEINRARAEQIRDLLGENQCPVCYVCEEKPEGNLSEENGFLYPVSIHEQTEWDPFGSQEELDQMAFNTDLTWNANKNIDSKKAFRLFREDPYRHTSSMSFVLSLKYKLYSVGISFDRNDPAEGETSGAPADEVSRMQAAERFQDEILSKLDGDDEEAQDAKEKFNQLAWLEHRRWVLWQVITGWSAARDENGEKTLRDFIDLQKGTAKNAAARTHACIAYSTTETPLEGFSDEKWAAYNILENPDQLDDLDLMSVELYQILQENAQGKGSDPEPFMAVIQELISGQDKAVVRAYQHLEFCLTNIRSGITNDIEHYDHFERKFLEEMESIDENLKQKITSRLYNLRESISDILLANKRVDYKKIDGDLIRRIPFILTNRQTHGLVMAFEDGKCLLPEEDQGKNEIAFPNVASATVLCPSEICYLYCFDQKSDAGTLKPDVGTLFERMKGILYYFNRRRMTCRIKMQIACVGDAAFQDDCKNEIQKKFSEAAGKNWGHQITAIFLADDVELFSCSDKSEASDAFLERVGTLKDHLYDGSNRLFHSKPEDDQFVNGLNGIMPTFRFDWRHKKFVDRKDCEYLKFIKDDSYLHVDDMFALMGAEDNRTTIPEYKDDYMDLWNIFTRKFAEGQESPGDEAPEELAERFSKGADDWHDLQEKIRGRSKKVIASFPSDSFDEASASDEGNDTNDLIEMEFILPVFAFQTVQNLKQSLVESKRATEFDLSRYSSLDCRLRLTTKKRYAQAYRDLFREPQFLQDYYNVNYVREKTKDRGVEYRVERNTFEIEGAELDSFDQIQIVKELEKYQFIRNLRFDEVEVDENGKVKTACCSFQYASPRIWEMLTKSGNILETYLYYEVLKTGYFDDVVSAYPFLHSKNSTKKNELDMVATKGFRSVIVECKIKKIKKEQDKRWFIDGKTGFLTVLHKKIKDFELGATKVLLADLYFEVDATKVSVADHNKKIKNIVNNEKVKKEAENAGITILYEPEDIQNIGERLQRMMEEEMDEEIENEG